MSTTPHPTPSPFMLLFRNAGPEPHAHLTAEQKAAMAKQWNDWLESLTAQGKVQQAHPLGLGGRVVAGPNGARVTDGPYAETKEAIGGYFLVLASDLDEAAALAKDCPGLAIGMTVEVRALLNCSPVLNEVRARPSGSQPNA